MGVRQSLAYPTTAKFFDTKNYGPRKSQSFDSLTDFENFPKNYTAKTGFLGPIEITGRVYFFCLSG